MLSAQKYELAMAIADSPRSVREHVANLSAKLAASDARIQELESKLKSAENQLDELLYALERIELTVPGQGDGGGFVFDHYDHEGEYIGSQNVDPTWVVFEMAGVATNAIAAVKGAQ